MTLEWVVIIILLGLTALGLFIRTFIKSTVSESIKHQFETERQKMREEFEREIHGIDRKDRFRLAALDKRLAAHQEAYKIAVNLYWTTHDKGNIHTNAQNEYSEFWNNNCLYLTQEAREALWQSSISHRDYDIFLKIYHDDPNDPTAKKDLNERFEMISKAPDIIMSAVDRETLAIEPTLPNGKKITAFEIIEEKKDEVQK